MEATQKPLAAAAPEPGSGSADGDPGGVVGVAGAVVWVLVVGAAVAVGSAFVIGSGVSLEAAPFYGRWHWHLRPGLVGPVLFAGVVVVTGPRIAARLSVSALAVTAGLAATAWAVLLAASDGWDRVTAPLTSRTEYEPYAATIDDVGEFLRTFVSELPNIPVVHVQGHPPGITLVPWALDRIGLAGAGWFALVVLVGWGVAVAAALLAARSVAGDDAARRAAPALVLLPGAVWAATSADALFAGVLAAGLALAVSGGRVRAVAGGTVLGIGLLLTYGGVLIAAIAGTVHLVRRRVDLALATAAGALAVLVGVALTTGFWWLDGLEATRAVYSDGVASRRPSGYLAILGNPGALLVAVGPAVAAGLALAVQRWRHRAALLPLISVGAVVVADASLLSKGEVERIWLIFVPWLALAAPGDRGGWLVAQALVAIVAQSALVGSW